VIGRGHQLVEHSRVGGRPVGAHLGRLRAVLERPAEEPAGSREISFLGHQYVEDLAELINHPVQIDPSSRDFDVCFIDEPPIARDVSAGSCRVDQQRGEPLHPPVHAQVINHDAPFCQQLLHIAVRKALSEVPTHRHQYYFRRKPIPSKARSWCWYTNTTTTHHLSLPGSCPPPMQQTPQRSLAYFVHKRAQAVTRRTNVSAIWVFTTPRTWVNQHTALCYDWTGGALLLNSALEHPLSPHVGRNDVVAVLARLRGIEQMSYCVRRFYEGYRKPFSVSLLTGVSVPQ
jgi:hypothetical protein